MSQLMDKNSAEVHLGTTRCAYTMMQALNDIANGELTVEQCRTRATDTLADVAPSGVEISLKACAITIEMLEKTIAGDDMGALLASMRLVGLVAELTEISENPAMLRKLGAVL